MSFQQFEVHPKCLSQLEQQGITEPTPVQNEAIPLALQGRDVIAVAQTGTGKTLAFTLPSITQLENGKRKRVRMLVLTPTRELAQQVEKVIKPMARAIGMRSVCIFGGVGMKPQTDALRGGTEIVIATPGRLLDHMERGNVRFNELSMQLGFFRIPDPLIRKHEVVMRFEVFGVDAKRLLQLCDRSFELAFQEMETPYLVPHDAVPRIRLCGAA